MSTAPDTAVNGDVAAVENISASVVNTTSDTAASASSSSTAVMEPPPLLVTDPPVIESEILPVLAAVTDVLEDVITDTMPVLSSEAETAVNIDLITVPDIQPATATEVTLRQGSPVTLQSESFPVSSVHTTPSSISSPSELSADTLERHIADIRSGAMTIPLVRSPTDVDTVLHLRPVVQPADAATEVPSRNTVVTDGKPRASSVPTEPTDTTVDAVTALSASVSENGNSGLTSTMASEAAVSTALTLPTATAVVKGPSDTTADTVSDEVCKKAICNNSMSHILFSSSFSNIAKISIALPTRLGPRHLTIK